MLLPPPGRQLLERYPTPPARGRTKPQIGPGSRSGISADRHQAALEEGNKWPLVRPDLQRGIDKLIALNSLKKPTPFVWLPKSGRRWLS